MGKVDCWVMALPNGVCKPYIEALNQVREETGKKTLIVDLSADYRFDDTWTYGLPELTKRSAIAQSKNISNPMFRYGCPAGSRPSQRPLSRCPRLRSEWLFGCWNQAVSQERPEQPKGRHHPI